MEESKSAVRNNIAGFRKRLMDDPLFRRTFASDPEGTLRASGISVPAGANIATIDVSELEARVGRLKDALGDNVDALYSEEAFDQVTRDPEKVLWLQEIMSAARNQPRELETCELEAVAGGRKGTGPGDTYRISVYGSISW